MSPDSGALVELPYVNDIYVADENLLDNVPVSSYHFDTNFKAIL